MNKEQTKSENNPVQGAALGHLHQSDSRDKKGGKLPEHWEKCPSEAAVLLLRGGTATPLFYQSTSGEAVEIAGTEYTELIQQGALELYKNPREWQDNSHPVTGEAGKWNPAYILVAVPNGSLAPVAKNIDALMQSSDEISTKIGHRLVSFLRIIHSTRVQPSAQPNISAIKAEVNQHRALMVDKIGHFTAAQHSWRQKAKELRQQLVGADTELRFADAVLTAADPGVRSGIALNLQNTENVLLVDNLIFDRDEVLSVNAGFTGIRIDLDKRTIIRHGIPLVDYQKQLETLLRKNGLAGGIDFKLL